MAEAEKHPTKAHADRNRSMMPDLKTSARYRPLSSSPARIRSWPGTAAKTNVRPTASAVPPSPSGPSDQLRAKSPE